MSDVDSLHHGSQHNPPLSAAKDASMIAPSSAAGRRAFREALGRGSLLRFPGAFEPIVAKLIERRGFEGVYVSGAALAATQGMPDIGLTTQTEVVARAQAIARATGLPTIVDIDTGFGGPLNAARTVALLEEAGLAGCHLEDQENPKRCGHLERKTVVSTAAMVRRIRAAAEARRDADFLLIARTDARGPEGLECAIDRAKAYVDAGAEMIFPEALESVREFEAFRAALDVPLMANMTEFGKSPLLSRRTLEALGYDMAIYPVTTLRLALKAVEEGLDHLNEAGDQAALVPRMMTRSELYDIVDYAGHARFDARIADFAEE